MVLDLLSMVTPPLALAFGYCVVNTVHVSEFS